MPPRRRPSARILTPAGWTSLAAIALAAGVAALLVIRNAG